MSASGEETICALATATGGAVAIIRISGAGALVGMFFVAFSKNGIIGKNRKEVRARVKAQSQQDRAEELAYLAQTGEIEG